MTAMLRTAGLLAVLILQAAPAGSSPAQPAFSDGKAGIAVQVQGEVIPYEVFAFFPLPGETLQLRLVKPKPDRRYVLRTPDGREEGSDHARWNWTAPEQAGLYPLRITSDAAGESITLNVFVRIPAGRVKEGSLNGYTIGSYPSTQLRGLAIYKPPRGFVEVTRENENVMVSPHFRLEQFLCRQEGGYPKYLVLKPRLLLKLELILQRVNAAGFRCDTFQVLSGYRTPFYNKAIGNVKYSRHVWGGAADIFIDENPRDGMMDDLNGDGLIDYRDAAVLYDLIDDLYGKPDYEPFAGGLGRYKKTAAHGPFVHVDVRGFRARWGT